MNRRRLLKIIVRGAAYAPLVPAITLAAPPRRVVVQQSPIAGFQYYQGEQIFDHLHVGTPLSLVRDAGNKYDDKAVAVYAADAKLGFVPRSDNCAISQLMDRGEKLSAKVVALDNSRTPWDRIRFEVALDG